MTGTPITPLPTLVTRRRRVGSPSPRPHPVAGNRPWRLLIGALALLALIGLGASPANAQVAPGNDNFANATTITGLSGSISGTNVGATKEPGEPNHAGNPGGSSIWYAWTAPNTSRP